MDYDDFHLVEFYTWEKKMQGSAKQNVHQLTPIYINENAFKIQIKKPPIFLATSFRGFIYTHHHVRMIHGARRKMK